MSKLTINPDGFIRMSTGYLGTCDDFFSKTGLRISLPPGFRYLEFDSSTMRAFGHTIENGQAVVSGVDLSVYADALERSLLIKPKPDAPRTNNPLILTAEPEAGAESEIRLPVVVVDRIRK